MENDENVVPREEENLAAQMPDPAGPPQPVQQAYGPPLAVSPPRDPVLAAMTVVGVVLVVVTGLVVLVGRSTRATCGATRSARLQWQDRQGQIEQAIRQDQAASAEPLPKPAG